MQLPRSSNDFAHCWNFFFRSIVSLSFTPAKLIHMIQGDFYRKGGAGLTLNNQEINIPNTELEEIPTDDLFLERLAAFGGLISTIGGIISTTAAFLALQEQQQQMEKESRKSTKYGGSDPKLEEMEEQIQYLMKEIDTLKKQNRKGTYAHPAKRQK